MENYLVSNKTIAVIKNKRKTIIINVDKVVVINKSIKNILEYNCNYYGSSFDGRIKCAKDILNIKYKIPIVIDDKNNIVLISLNSPRNSSNVYLVTNKILNYEIINNNLRVFCLNNVNFKVKLSKNVFEKLLLNSIKIINTLNWRKNVNLL